VWSTEQAVWFGQQIEEIRNDYLEDPVFGLNGMRRVREKVRMPLATNTVVVNFEQLAANILNTAVDVILLDTTFWGGIRQCVKAANVCETFQLGVAVHSSGELGIQLATMLHLGAVIPNLSFAADAHYHHLTDDVIEGGLMPYENGAIRVPDKPGLGVKLDRDKLRRYHELYRRLGGYAYDRDPRRPGWTAIIPNDGWADRKAERPPREASRPAPQDGRRFFARAGMRFEAQIDAQDGAPGVTVQGLNMHRRGALVSAKRPLARGSKVFFNMFSAQRMGFAYVCHC